MLKVFFLNLVFVAAISLHSTAQDIGTNEAQLSEKISKKMANDGYSNKVSFDTATKTFAVSTGKKYRVVSAVNASSKEARRLIVYELNEDGSHKKSFTSKSSKSFRDGGAQVFTLNLPALPAKETALTMKVDARPTGKVYIFSN